MIKAPCKNCEKRKLHCHSKCTEYLTFKKEWEQVRKKDKAYRDKNAMDIESALRAKCSAENDLKAVYGYSRNRKEGRR